MMKYPHPAIVCSGPQLIGVIEGLEDGSYPLPGEAIWRGDLEPELRLRLARATGATEEQIRQCIDTDLAQIEAMRTILAAEAEAEARDRRIAEREAAELRLSADRLLGAFEPASDEGRCRNCGGSDDPSGDGHKSWCGVAPGKMYDPERGQP